MRAMWNDAKDLLFISQRTPQGYLTFASPSVASLLGDDLAHEWGVGVEHQHAGDPALGGGGGGGGGGRGGVGRGAQRGCERGEETRGGGGGQARRGSCDETEQAHVQRACSLACAQPSGRVVHQQGLRSTRCYL